MVEQERRDQSAWCTCVLGAACTEVSAVTSMQVFVPNGELQSVLVTSPLSVVILAPGFRLPSLTINNGYNAAQTIVLDLQARFLNIISSG